MGEINSIRSILYDLARFLGESWLCWVPTELLCGNQNPYRKEEAMKRAMILVLVIGLLSGCASTGRKIDQSAADKIEKGKTTKQEVIGLIGSPDRIMRRGNGETTFTYSYARATAKPATFIPIFGPLVGGANVQSQMFMVTFNSDGVVKDFISSQGGTEVDRGLATGSKAEIKDVEEGKRPK